MSAPAAPVRFDPRALVDPVDRFEVRDFVQRMQQSGAAPSRFGSLTTVVPLIIGGAFFIAFGSVFVTVFASILASLASIDNGVTGGSFIISAIGSVLPILVIGGAFAAVIVFVWRGSRTRYERWFRLDRFATANGMTYLPGLQSPGLPGMIFNVGSSRGASDLVRGETPRFVEFANYEYTTGSGKNRTTHRWGYVAIKLDVPLPHIVLDATSNNSLFGSNLPATFDKDQRLSLEGDFDEHFALFCPEGYERDALYLFTPDIMARFIDNAAALDVEIVDDWLFLYGKREFSSLDPATWAWLFSVVAALLDKFAQWARWRDQNLRADAAAALPLDGLRTRTRTRRPAPHPTPLCPSRRRWGCCARRRGSPQKAGGSNVASPCWRSWSPAWSSRSGCGARSRPEARRPVHPSPRSCADRRRAPSTAAVSAANRAESARSSTSTARPDESASGTCQFGYSVDVPG